MFFHGNGDDLRGAQRATAGLADAGFGVLLFEYRGYGGNRGRPSEAGLYGDGRAALTWLAAQGVAERQVVLIGNSLGSGVATELATANEVAALILVSGYTALLDVAAGHYPWLPERWLIADRFDNAAKLSRVQVPILLLHGTEDRLIPISHADRLAAVTANATLERVRGVGHELVYLPQAQARILTSLASAGVLTRRAADSRVRWALTPRSEAARLRLPAPPPATQARAHRPGLPRGAAPP